MDIYLIRHTQTATLNGLCYGQKDVELAETFAEEALRIQAKLPKITAECLVISSPLQRCIKLAETFKQPIRIDERIQEINFGDWENCRFDDIDAEILQNWTENFVTIPPPNGESFNDLCQRTGEFWEELIALKPTEQVIVITHAGVVRALLANLLELPPANAFKFRVDVGSVHKLQYLNNYTFINYLNQ